MNIATERGIMNKHLEARGFDTEIQEDWGLNPNKDCIKISYLDQNGNILYYRTNRPGKDPKYLSPKSEDMPGGHSHLYGLNMTKNIEDTLLLIEGEYNTISAWIMGYKALGVAGQAMSLKDHHLKAIPDSVKKIIILYDDPGFAKKRADEILKFYEHDIEVYIATYPDGKDANDYYREDRIIDFKAIINIADRYWADTLKSPFLKVEIPEDDFIEIYKNYALQISDAPAKYQELMALSVISTVLGRQAFLKYGDSNLYPNLYIVLIGKSTVMRKTDSLNRAKKIIRKFNKNLLLPYDFTPEGLFNLLTENPRGLISWSEFGAFLTNASQKTYQAGIKEFLTEAYDCPEDLRKRLSGKEYQIENICLNIISATTLHWFTDRINEADTLGGFLGRFVYMPCTLEDKNGWYYMPQPEDSGLSNMLVKKLKDISKLKGEVKISEEAKTLLIKWLRRHEDELETLEDSKGIVGFYARLADYLLKFAMLYEISGTGKMIISEGSLLRSIKLVNHLKITLKSLMADHVAFTREAKDTQKVLGLIRAEDTISRAKLLQNSHLSAKQLDEVLTTLLQSEQVRVITIGTGRKKTRAYKIVY
jgi:hypothetical protein